MGMFNSSWFKRADGMSPRTEPQQAGTGSAAICMQGSRPPMAPELAQERIWVIYASETGVAEHLAMDACQALHNAGVATKLLPFDKLDLAALQTVDRALFLVSTCYDGDPPDMAENFFREHMWEPASLPLLCYGTLALGDSCYDEFCGFGRRLHQWLQASGGQAWFEPVEMDNEAEAAARRWQGHVDEVIKLCRHAGYPAS